MVLLPSQIINLQMNLQITRKFRKRKAYSLFRDIVWVVDLADIQSLSKYKKGIRYLLCAIELFSKFVWVVFLKD